MNDALDQPERALAKRQLGASRRAEQVRRQPERRTFDLGEQQGRPAGGDDAPVNLGDFEVRIDGSVDGDEVTVAAATG